MYAMRENPVIKVPPDIPEQNIPELRTKPVVPNPTNKRETKR